MPDPTLAALDEQHRLAQAQNANAAAKIILAYWLLVRGDDLAGTGGEWLRKSESVIVRGFRRSAELAFAYALRVRALQAPQAPALRLPSAPAPNLAQIRQSLTYTGLTTAAVSLAKVPKPPQQPDVPPDEHVADTLEKRRVQVVREAGAKAAAAAVRHVQNGGRTAIDDVVKQDPVAKGWVRITRDQCCYFCAMLASRGPVYEEDSFARSDPRFTGPGEHKVHDSCGCSLRPVYSRSLTEWPEKSLQASDLWYSAASRYSGEKAVKAFRQAYEGREVTVK